MADPFSVSSGSSGAGSINAPDAGADRFQPQMATVTRQPARPSWNPVEEARRQAEAKAAAAGPVGPPAKSSKKSKTTTNRTTTTRSTGVSSPDGDNGRARHHTLLPRLMVVAGLALSPFSSVITPLLERMEHAITVDGETRFDSTGRLAYIAVVGGSIALYLAGWVWWTAAAAANARMKTRRAGSPSFPVLAVLTLGAFIVVAVRWRDRLSPNIDLVLIAGLVVAGLAVVVGVPLSFRRSAVVMAAPTVYWTRMFTLPLVAAAITFAGGLAAVMTGNGIFVLPGAVLNLFILVWFMVNIVQAMASFDRATRVPNRDVESAPLPEFMRR